jgi:hypothetical protein
MTKIVADETWEMKKDNATVSFFSLWGVKKC